MAPGRVRIDGAGYAAAMPTGGPTVQSQPGDLLTLDRERCVELLAASTMIRVAFVAGGEPTILPVNHLLHGEAVYFRTAPGSKLGTAAAGGRVALEADHGDPATRTGWSVVAHGRASIVTDEAEVEALHAYSFEPWALPDARAFWVRVDVDDISGREIVARA